MFRGPLILSSRRVTTARAFVADTGEDPRGRNPEEGVLGVDRPKEDRADGSEWITSLLDTHIDYGGERTVGNPTSRTRGPGS